MHLEKLIIQIHGVKNIMSLIKLKPEGAEFIAVNRYKCGSIFYKNQNNNWFADYLNGTGWCAVQQNSLDQLSAVLNDLSFSIVRMDLLEKELELEQCCKGSELKNFDLLKQQVCARIGLVELRQAEDGRGEYWRGHADAYEVVKHLMTAISAA